MSSTKIRLASEADQKSYNDFLGAHSGAQVFQRFEWGGLADLYGHRGLYLIAESGDLVIGVLPLFFLKSLLFGRQVISLPYCEYGGPLALDDSPAITSALVTEAVRLAKDLGADSVELRGITTAACPLVEACGFKPLGKNVTFKLDLTRGKEAIWQGLEGGRVRTAVRKAEKHAVEIIAGEGPSDIEDYYRLRLLTEKRHGSPPHSLAFYRRIWEDFGGAGLLQLNFAVHQGRRIAAILFFPFQDKIMYWSNVATDDARQFEAQTYLVWKAIEWGCENGYRTFDMGRTRHGTGVYSYKKGFGGVEEPLNDYVLFFGKEKSQPDPDQGIYRVLTSLWSKLPIPIARALGPYIVKDIGL